MSRIGRQPIAVPAGVGGEIDGRTDTVKGPQGTPTPTGHSNTQGALEGGALTAPRSD